MTEPNTTALPPTSRGMDYQCATASRCNPRILTLHLCRKWWEQIRDGAKKNEYRLCSPRNATLLERRGYDEVHLWLGYPAKTETDKRLIRKFCVVTRTTITHEHFGPDPVEVFDIKLGNE